MHAVSIEYERSNRKHALSLLLGQRVMYINIRDGKVSSVLCVPCVASIHKQTALSLMGGIVRVRFQLVPATSRGVGSFELVGG